MKTREHVTNGVIAHVAHVQLARRIGEHGQAVVLGLGAVFGGFERVTVVPKFLCLSFDLAWRIMGLHVKS